MFDKKTVLLFISLSASFILLLYAPSPQRQNDSSSLFAANPLILRAVSTNAHTLLADKLWLDSNNISELGSKNSSSVDSLLFYRAFINIATLDPCFFHAINYGATYLASVPKESRLASNIISSAALFNKDDFRLYFLWLLVEITYEKEPNYERVAWLVKKLAPMSEFREQIGIADADSFLLRCLSFAANKTQKRQKAIEDLQWLAKNTKEKSKRALIESELAMLERSDS